MKFVILLAIGGGTLHYTGNDESPRAQWETSSMEAKKFASKDEALARCRELQVERDNEPRFYLNGRRCEDSNGFVFTSEVMW